MIVVPIVNIPNQSLSIQLDGINFDIRIHDCESIMSFDITINNVLTLSGIRAVPLTGLIPYAYLEQGNFVVITANEEIPDWSRFGIDQYLLYVTEAELETLRAGA